MEIDLKSDYGKWQKILSDIFGVMSNKYLFVSCSTKKKLEAHLCNKALNEKPSEFLASISYHILLFCLSIKKHM